MIVFVTTFILRIQQSGRARKYKATYEAILAFTPFLVGAYFEPVYSLVSLLAIESAKTLKLGLDDPAIY